MRKNHLHRESTTTTSDCLVFYECVRRLGIGVACGPCQRLITSPGSVLKAQIPCGRRSAWDQGAKVRAWCLEAELWL